ncbi:MAG: 30S ribosomal protein S4 [Anaerolineae bacterium]|nr:30S ribosomal protein S4 [Anaerolineae bacterium]NUQ04163.1 30S ribosomal protein S4 [Anaerolineae bacterium]
MASYHGPKAKVQRRFGEVLISRAKYQKILEKRPYPPGDHGKEKQYRSGRRSDFGLQLFEKQKLSFIYNIRETQMRSYFKRALQMTGNTGSNLLILLERRLDNVVYRAGFAATIFAARQIVKHGHVLVNGQRVDLPSFQVNPGMVLSLTDAMRKNVHVIDALESTAHNLEYVTVNREAVTATLTRLPDRKELPLAIDEQLVVEYYNRLG